MQAAIVEGCNKWTRPDGFKPKYGAAGFRAEGHLLHSTMFRCGILMAIRALKTKQVTGICITASHNPAPDNGVKLVEPTGEMLLQSYESIADELANIDSGEELASKVAELLKSEGIAIETRGTVLIAHDTRPSGPELVTAVVAGVECLGLDAKVLGLLLPRSCTGWLCAPTNGFRQLKTSITPP